MPVSRKSGNDQVSEEEKQKLLTHLKKEHGDTSGEAQLTRLTLQRKTRSTLKCCSEVAARVRMFK